MKKLIAWISEKDFTHFMSVASTGAKAAIEQLPVSRLTGLPKLSDIMDKTIWDEVYLLCPFQFPLDIEFQAYFGPIVKIVQTKIELNDKVEIENFNIFLNEIREITGKKTKDYYLLLPSTNKLDIHYKILKDVANSLKIYCCELKNGNVVSHGNPPEGFNITRRPEYFRNQFGTSKNLIRILHFIKLAIASDAPVLLTGEQGTGRKKISQIIAEQQNNGSEATEIVSFPSVSCRMDEELSKIIGQSNTKTIILDNIDQCHIKTQLELLKILRLRKHEQGLPHSSGNDTQINPQIRTIITSTQNLLKLVKDKLFLEELYYHLADIAIELPPLRTRGGTDIKLIASNFLEKINDTSQGKNWKYFSQDAMKVLETYTWPGNIRELEQVVRQANLFSKGKIIQAEDLPIFSETSIQTKPDKSKLSKPNFSLDEEVDRLKIFYIKQALELNGGIKTKASEMLGLKNYQTLSRMIKDYKLE